MQKYLANNDVLQRFLSCREKKIIDVGCGNGDTVRWLAEQGAHVIGLDNREMLTKAQSLPSKGSELYVEGGAQKLPFANESADGILYFASFHHVAVESMTDAARECRRVLKNGGRAVFVEPVYQNGAYSEITSLVEDEREWQKKAYAVIVSLDGSGMTMEKEEIFFLERSFADYVRLIEFFVNEKDRRDAILAQARKITEKLSAATGRDYADFRYRSICRLNILLKKSE